MWCEWLQKRGSKSYGLKLFWLAFGLLLWSPEATYASCWSIIKFFGPWYRGWLVPWYMLANHQYHLVRREYLAGLVCFYCLEKKNSEYGPSGNGLTLLEYGRMCSYFSYFYSYFTFEHILAFWACNNSFFSIFFQGDMSSAKAREMLVAE